MLAEEAKEKRDKEFKSLAQNLHHLMSTQHIRGVYNPIPQYVMVCDEMGLCVELKRLNSDRLPCLYDFAHSNRR